MENLAKENNPPVQVNRRHLDMLSALAGELVLGRNQLLQGINNSNMETIELSGQTIDLITSEIQDVIMQTRMQPVDSLFEKICIKFKSKVTFDQKGKEFSLDRTIHESLKEPLDALVNFICKFEQNNNQNKNQTKQSDGHKIVLKAFQDAGQINIIIAAENILISMADIPKDVTDAIKEIGGIIEVDSQDKGCNVFIKLPLTLAIIPSQIACVGKDKFIIPQANLSELLRVSAAEAKDRIEKVGDADVIRLRGTMLPLVNLSELLGIKRLFTCPETNRMVPERRKNISDRRSQKYNTDGSIIDNEKTTHELNLQKRNRTDRRKGASGVTNIAVVFAGNYKYGLIVDKFCDSEEIVVKPVGRYLQKYKIYAGATIMGDGKVSLILDILNLAHMAGLSSVSESEKLPKNQEKNKKHNQSIALFKNMETEYFAASFEYIQRIERIPRDSIELIGKKRVTQYRGGALSLYDLSQIADVQPLSPKELQEVIVFKVNRHEFGLIVSPPVDIIQSHLNIDEKNFKNKGIRGTATINGHTTLVLDILKIANSLCGDIP
jgi:two-component system chemotaxis sensor kinase CheA